MVLYNITFVVDEDINENWLKWMKKVFIPACEATGYFEAIDFFSIHRQSADHTKSYSTHLYTKTKKHLIEFHQVHGEKLLSLPSEEFGSKCQSFDTVLEKII